MGRKKKLRTIFFMVAFITLGSREGFSAAIKDYDQHMQQASAFRSGGKPDKAEAIYSDILSQNSDDADALVARGLCRMRDPRLYEGAITDFQKAIALAPYYVDAYIGQAGVYRRQGKWSQAKKILSECEKVCQGDAEKMRYLAALSWGQGYYVFARRLDKKYPPDPKRILVQYPSEIAAYYTYDWVNEKSSWEESGTVLSHIFRPDLSANLSYSTYRRNNEHDCVFGVGMAYRYNYYLTLEHQMYFAQEGTFLAKQKYRPRVSVRFPTETMVSLGGNLDKYTDHWAKVAVFGVQQRVGPIFIDYTLQSGEDNFGKGVITHIGKMGYEKEGQYSVWFGHSIGNESLDVGAGSSFSGETVEVFFGNIRYYFGPRWGIIAVGGREYRDHDFYRDTASLSIFMRF